MCLAIDYNVIYENILHLQAMHGLMKKMTVQKIWGKKKNGLIKGIAYVVLN